MKLSLVSIAAILASHITAHPQGSNSDIAQRDAPLILSGPVSEVHDHWKRKGGGGGGGKGGGGGGSSGGKSGGSSGGGSSSGGGGTRTTGSSNVGGATRLGSGPTRNYGGGRYYGGGAAQPYSPGKSSPRGIAAVPLVGAALLVYPGLWLYGAYAYPYGHPYTFRNRTSRRNRTSTATSAVSTATTVPRGMAQLVERQEVEGEEETKPVTCLCAMEASCGCDDSGDNTFLDSIIGDGDYSKLNQTLVQVADINGTSTIILNGTLPNGTTAPGGVDDAASGFRPASIGGYLFMVAVVGFSVFLV